MQLKASYSLCENTDSGGRGGVFIGGLQAIYHLDATVIHNHTFRPLMRNPHTNQWNYLPIKKTKAKKYHLR